MPRLFAGLVAPSIKQIKEPWSFDLRSLMRSAVIGQNLVWLVLYPLGAGCLPFVWMVVESIQQGLARLTADQPQTF
jgi:hypothetical protein